jgi:head-tail adaptor
MEGRPVRAGLLDSRITIQRKTINQSSSGQPTETWSILANRFASKRPVRGDERFSAAQYAAEEQTQFEIRYNTTLADLSPLDRIVYPALDEGASPEPIPTDRTIYDILAVHEIGRRDGLRIIAVRHTDT